MGASGHAPHTPGGGARTAEDHPPAAEPPQGGERRPAASPPSDQGRAPPRCRRNPRQDAAGLRAGPAVIAHVHLANASIIIPEGIEGDAMTDKGTGLRAKGKRTT